MQCRTTLERMRFGLLACGLMFGNFALSQTSAAGSSSTQSMGSVSAADLGVSFIKDSTSQIVVEHDGKKYVVDAVSHEIRELPAAAATEG